MTRLRSLKIHVLSASFLIIAVIGVLIALTGIYVIQRERAQRTAQEVSRAISTARTVYENELAQIRSGLEITARGELENVRNKLGLDYVYEISASQARKSSSEVVRAAAQEGKAFSASRIITRQELSAVSTDLAQASQVVIRQTQRARPTTKQWLEDALALECAIALTDDEGNVSAVRYGGIVINNDFTLVDRIRSFIFEQELFQGKAVGTVTIFQDDVRVSTNVLDNDGKRAVGTRVSQQVYDRVVRKGEVWHARAFVVNDWYLTVYEPVRNVNGEIIGILYVGILEKPFLESTRKLILMFLTIILAAAGLGSCLAYLFALRVSSPLARLAAVIRDIGAGNLESRVDTTYTIKEFSELAATFNLMADALAERQQKLAASKGDVEMLNKRYLDLVGFVSHELKGILASLILNIHNLKSGLLGELTPKQDKVVASLSRNLDYLSSTVLNFLNLSRIEKEEMKVNKTSVLLKESIFDIAIESFDHLLQENKMSVANNIEPQARVQVDPELLRIVANNLLSNAIKYGSAGGRIIISSRIKGTAIEIEVYNDGAPIAELDKEKLFKKFSRLHYENMKRTKGTGIGLFITREIILQHGGTIRVEPRPEGNAFIFELSKDGETL